MDVALSEGRLSKWEQLLNEMTYHDVAVLQAYAKVHPFGERRTDIRDAWNTAIIAGSLSGSPPEPGEIIKYLAEEESKDDGFMSPNAAAATMAQAYPNLVK